jgi:hypothetical protein
MHVGGDPCHRVKAIGRVKVIAHGAAIGRAKVIDHETVIGPVKRIVVAKRIVRAKEIGRAKEIVRAKEAGQKLAKVTAVQAGPDSVPALGRPALVRAVLEHRDSDRDSVRVAVALGAGKVPERAIVAGAAMMTGGEMTTGEEMTTANPVAKSAGRAAKTRPRRP